MPEYWCKVNHFSVRDLLIKSNRKSRVNYKCTILTHELCKGWVLLRKEIRFPLLKPSQKSMKNTLAFFDRFEFHLLKLHSAVLTIYPPVMQATRGVRTERNYEIRKTQKYAIEIQKYFCLYGCGLLHLVQIKIILKFTFNLHVLYYCQQRDYETVVLNAAQLRHGPAIIL